MNAPLNKIHFQSVPDLPCFEGLYEELVYLLENNIIEWGKHKQICINATPDKPDDYGHGGGSLYYNWDNPTIVNANGMTDITIPKYDTPLEESDFSVLCTVFKNTKFEALYNTLAARYKLGRVRFMRSEPKTCLSWHVDSSRRLHFPLKTAEGCLMVIEDEVMHLPVNQWTMTNTVIPHTAFNGSKGTRIHIVASILE
jgi:hypothetical protein